MTLEQIKEHNITNEELELLSVITDSISDFDYGYNPKTDEFDRPGIEWDGPYGRHWDFFDTEEQRTLALERHSLSQLDFIPQVRNILAKQNEAKRKAGIAKANKKRKIREAKTLGGQHEVLGELLVKMKEKY